MSAKSGNEAVVNIAAYKFASFSRKFSRELKARLELVCEEADLRGTVLIGAEGINLSVAGSRTALDKLQEFLAHVHPALKNLTYKTSLSKTQPFRRMKIRIKPEIISMGVPEANPITMPGMRISPDELKRWFDEKLDFTILDTRNEYEIAAGSFEGALNLHLDDFSSFPEAVPNLDPALRTKPLVMYCTGGIRCEKASSFLLQNGFDQVYQLDGGILGYFEEWGSSYYRGNCFVFDERVAIDPDLNETGSVLCQTCQYPISPEVPYTKAEPICWRCRPHGNPSIT